MLQSGHYSSVQEEGGQWEFNSTNSTERCGPIKLAGRLEGLQVTLPSPSSLLFFRFAAVESVIYNKPQ